MSWRIVAYSLVWALETTRLTKYGSPIVVYNIRCCTYQTQNTIACRLVAYSFVRSIFVYSFLHLLVDQCLRCHISDYRIRLRVAGGVLLFFLLLSIARAAAVAQEPPSAEEAIAVAPSHKKIPYLGAKPNNTRFSLR